jgi:uncharacterized protein
LKRLGLLLLFLCLVLESSSFGAGFDCGKASTFVEKTICSDSQLSELDSLMTEAYGIAMKDSGDPEALKAEQRSWLSNKRNRCRDIVCLRESYNDRITQLISTSGGTGGGSSRDIASGVPEVNAVTQDSINNATLKVAGLGEGESILEIPFKMGHFRKGSPNDEDFIDASIEKYAIGDLNGDNNNDAAIMINYNTGGSGSFYSLCAAISAPGNPVITDPILLGDRVGIKSLRVESGKVVLNLIKHKPTDPSCCPSVPVTLTYRVENGKLVGSRFKDY